MVNDNTVIRFSDYIYKIRNHLHINSQLTYIIIIYHCNFPLPNHQHEVFTIYV